jgi:hypothetical protein
LQNLRWRAKLGIFSGICGKLAYKISTSMDFGFAASLIGCPKEKKGSVWSCQNFLGENAHWYLFLCTKNFQF